MADDITKRRQQKAGTEAIDHAEDPENWIRVGMAVQVFGGRLAETGLGGRRAGTDQFAAEFGALLPVVAGLIDDLTTLKIGMRAKIVQLNGGRK